VAGVEGTVRVLALFSMIDISQIKQRLDSFSDNPTRYHKEFLCLTQAYALTWGDIYNIINDILIETKRNIAEQHTDQLHEQHLNRHPLPLRQYLKLRFSGTIKIGTQDQISWIV
jgi:hypothetical protein